MSQLCNGLTGMPIAIITMSPDVGHGKHALM